jgi:hypothetical protein
MSASLRIPSRHPAVWITREGKAWLVIAGDHGWLHGSYEAALRDARDIAKGFGCTIRVASTARVAA